MCPVSRVAVVPRGLLGRVARLLRAELEEARGELEAVEREIAVLEERYGVSSRELEAMLRGEEPWRLPEGAEPDVVEWEALLEQRRRLLRRLHWLEEVLCRLRMPSWPGLCTSSLPLLRRG